MEATEVRRLRKREVAALRSLLRREKMKVLKLATQLAKNKRDDVYTIATQLANSASRIRDYQARLNALLSRADELQILKRAARNAPSSESKTCPKCWHYHHPGAVCSRLIEKTDSDCRGPFTWTEQCGCAL